MSRGRCCFAVSRWLSCCLSASFPGYSEPDAPRKTWCPSPSKETLQYGVEWRLIRAGQARISFDPVSVRLEPAYDVTLRLESAGMVSKLYKVDDNYMAQSSGQLCADNIVLNAEEGKRKRRDENLGRSRPGQTPLPRTRPVDQHHRRGPGDGCTGLRPRDHLRPVPRRAC